jgi:hypothetical protein
LDTSTILFYVILEMINPKVATQGQCAAGYAFATIGAV